MNTLAKNLKRRMRDLGITQKELAEKVDISQVMVHKLTSGKTESTSKIVELSLALECDPSWLQSGKGKSPYDEDSNVLDSTERITGHYPLISWVQAGNWTESVEYAPSDFEYYPCPKKCSEKTFLLKVTGDSMEPRFQEGDLIYVDPLENAIHKKLVVAKLTDDNTTTFKQLIIEDGKKFLKALNPNWHTQYVPINGNCEIIGVVIYVGRDV